MRREQAGGRSEVPSWLAHLLRAGADQNANHNEPELLEGTILARRFRIARRLAAGGFGVVYRARDRVLRRSVALKIIRLQRLRNLDLTRYVSKFLEEARLTSQLNHPNIVVVHDLDRIRAASSPGAPSALWETPFLVTELIRGTTMRAWTRESIALDRWLPAMISVAEALCFAHDRGVIHRDLKPDNIMLAGGRVKVLDFGLAEVFDRTDRALAVPAERVGMIHGGTAGYMAPEQLRSAEQSPKIDIFALGVIMYETLSGVRPELGAARALRSFRPDVPASLEELIGRCLEIDPANRISSANALLDHLLRNLRVFGASSERAPAPDAAGDCPFPGLSAFRESESRFFFGRDRDVTACLNMLDAPRRWLWIEAPSGHGKSSFMRAALLPLVRLRWPSATPEMLELEVRPRLSFRDALIESAGGQFKSREAGALTGELCRDPRPAIILIDQFEEIFFGDTEALNFTAEFIERILSERTAPTLLICTVRSDLAHELSRNDRLGRSLNEYGRRYFLTQFSTSELRHLIEGPATLAGVAFEPGLVEKMIADCAGRPAILPLLAETLRLLWDRRRDGILSAAIYQQLGGVGGALARWAEELSSAAEKPEALRKLLCSMVSLRDGEPTTRPLRLTEARRIAGADANPLLDLCLGRTGGRALVRSDGEHLELIHEAILTHWPRMKQWLSEEKQAIHARDELERAASAWAETNYLADRLARGAQLSFFDGAHDSSELANRYLRASKARERRNRRTRNAVQAGVVILALITAGVIGWSIHARQETDQMIRTYARASEKLIEKSAREKLPGTLDGRIEVIKSAQPFFDAVATSTRAQVQTELFNARNLARDYYQGGRLDEYRRVVAEFAPRAKAVIESGADPQLSLEAGRFLSSIYFSYRNTENHRDALEYLRAGVRGLEQYAALNPLDTEALLEVAEPAMLLALHTDNFTRESNERAIARCDEIANRLSAAACSSPKCVEVLLDALGCAAQRRWFKGDYPAMREQLFAGLAIREALAKNRRDLGSQRSRAWSKKSLAQVIAYRGELETAKTLLLESKVEFLEIAESNASEEQWFALEPHVVDEVSADVARFEGDLETSRNIRLSIVRRSDRLDGLFQGTSSPQVYRARNTLMLAELALDEDDPVAARVFLEAATRAPGLETSAISKFHGYCRWMSIWAAVERRSGNYEIAKHMLDEVERVARSYLDGLYLDAMSWSATLSFERARAECDAGRPDAARSAFERAMVAADGQARLDPLDQSARQRRERELDAAWCW